MMETKEVKVWREKEATKREDHKTKMSIKYKTFYSPFSDKLYDLAWEYGHSDGFEQVEYYYSDLSELVVKD